LCYVVNNKSIIDDSPAALSLSAVPLYLHIKAECNTAVNERRIPPERSSHSPACRPRLPRCCGRSSSLLPPSSKKETPLSRPVDSASVCRWWPVIYPGYRFHQKPERPSGGHRRKKAPPSGEQVSSGKYSLIKRLLITVKKRRVSSKYLDLKV